MKLKQLIGCPKKKKDKKISMLLKKSSSKVEYMLDLRTLANHQMALKTLLRLLLPKSARKMVYM